MTLENDVAMLLGAWDQQLRNIDENLIALEGEPTYQMLSGGARKTLTGITSERVLPALDALTELFLHREQLSEVVARARELEKDAGFWDGDEKRKQILELLQGPSIKLGSRQTPLAQRHLLTPAATEVAVVPQQLLGAMAKAYEAARDVVAAVGAAWTRLELRLAEAEHEVETLRSMAQNLGLGEPPPDDLAKLGAELTRIRALVANDPLGVTGSFDADLAPRLLLVKKTLRELAEQKERVDRGLKDSLSLLERVTGMHAAAARASTTAAREISGLPVPVGAPDDEVAALRAWREKVVRVAEAGRWHAADVGLTNWFDAAREHLILDRAVCKAVEEAIDQRAELAGRLSARRAQAKALASRGAPGPNESLAQRAEELLAARPTDLQASTHAVDAYEADVLAKAGKRGGP